jgi:hypothetical protein
MHLTRNFFLLTKGHGWSSSSQVPDSLDVPYEDLNSRTEFEIIGHLEHLNNRYQRMVVDWELDSSRVDPQDMT